MTDDNRDDRDSLKVVRDRMSDHALPLSIRANLRDHYENLERLAENLTKVGMDDAQIDAHVVEIFKEYERELAANIDRIRDAEKTQVTRSVA